MKHVTFTGGHCIGFAEVAMFLKLGFFLPYIFSFVFNLFAAGPSFPISLYCLLKASTLSHAAVLCGFSRKERRVKKEVVKKKK